MSHICATGLVMHTWLLLCVQLPPSLSELTQLDTLVLDRTSHGTDEEKTAALEAALPPLQHLTQLVLKGMPGVAPAALGALSRLQRFGVEGTENESQVLPRGAWLNSLREVALPPQVLAANLGVLSGAVALERVDVRSLFGASVLTQTAILRWVAEHPSVPGHEHRGCSLQRGILPRGGGSDAAQALPRI